MRQASDDTVRQVTKLVLMELHRAGVSIASHPAQIPISISARHLHLSQADLETLFGKGFMLTVERPISQPGQFASGQFVSVVGPRGSIEKMRVLGPVRSQTQVELAMGDARRVGLTPPVRQSGDLAGSPGATLVGPVGQVTLPQGVILAERHIHMTPSDAARYGVADGQLVQVLLRSPKGGVLHNVAVRVRGDFALDMHLDTDDANAFLIAEGSVGTLWEGAI